MLATTDSTQKSAPPNASFDKRVWGVYCQLQKAVDNMDRKVELVMQKHQSQFLYAYRTHIHKIKRQLEDIKRKSEEQERLFSSNDRIRYLEKQVTVFREEAIKLYETIEKKSLEIQNYQARIVQAELISKKMEAQNKELSLQVKMLIANEVGFYRKIEELQTKLDESNKKIQKLEQKIASQRSRRDFMQSIRQRASSLAKSRENSPREIKTYKNQMQQWFLECVRTVKREIQQRKNNFDAIDLNKLTNLNQFRLVDKLRLFQLILQNEKLLNWLYHKIFPDKLDKISQYLSQTQSIPATDTDFKSQAVPSQRYGSSVQQNFQLPKVQSKKLRNSNIRNQVTIKNGKMNISIL